MTTTHIDAQVQDAINAAKAAGAVAPVMNTGGGVAVLPAGKPKTWDDAEAQASMNVDHYLKVDEYGLHVDDDKAAFETISVTIRLAEVILGDGVRYMAGGRAQYDKSLDGGVRSVRGKPWAEVVQQAITLDPACRGSYPLADVPMTLTKPLKLKNGTTIAAGARIGYTTSVTGYKGFISWAKDARANNGEEATIDVTVGFVSRKKNGNEWGEMTFTTVQ